MNIIEDQKEAIALDYEVLEIRRAGSSYAEYLASVIAFYESLVRFIDATPGYPAVGANLARIWLRKSQEQLFAYHGAIEC